MIVVMRGGSGLPPEWSGAIEGWVASLRAAARPETTISTRSYHLRRLANQFPKRSPWSLTTAELVGWAADHSWARETRRSYRSSLRTFYAWGIFAGLTDCSPAEGLPPVRPAQPSPRPASEAAYAQALECAPPRVALMLRLAGELGLRRAEVAVIHSADLVRDLVGWSLLVHGKGERRRLVPLPTSLAFELQHAEPGWLFPGNIDGHLSPRWVGKLVTVHLSDHWTMHSLRHRFASRAYAVDRDVLTVQDLLGHASPATTQRYVQLPDDAKRRLIDAVSESGKVYRRNDSARCKNPDLHDQRVGDAEQQTRA